ncbi:MAG: hypothetical protein H6543_00695 [Prevotellaceae bacterium]|nr:hypothetical protein [Prevotellaceae bacterium]
MKTAKLVIISGLMVLLISSCKNTQEIACTEEYRFVTITINGAQLDNFYTIRTSTGDTIRHNQEIGLDSNVYVVLTDSYQQTIQNSVENFIFQGFIADSLVINEPFVIKADQCHIDYVSGKTEINL